MKLKTFLFVAIIFNISCKVNKPYTEEMKSNIILMCNEDQEIQKKILETYTNKINRDSLEIRKKEIFYANYSIVKQYFSNYGYPTIKENSKEISKQFWLIIQHCDNDPDFQLKVLKEMKSHLKNNNVDKVNYAYLYDRVMINTGKEQLYGTQMDYGKNGEPFPKNLKDADNVNKRRAELGMESIEDYIKGMKYAAPQKSYNNF